MSIESVKRKNCVKFKARLPRNYPGAQSKIFARKTDAEKWLRRMRTETENRMALGLEAVARISFRDYAEAWFAKYVEIHLRDGTKIRYQDHLRIRILPIIGDLMLTEIKRDHVSAIVSRCKAEGSSPGTINCTLALLCGILNAAVKDQKIHYNPVAGTERLSEVPKDDVYWLDTEIEQFLKANQEDALFPVYVVAINTGMRRGEIAGLKWDRVNFALNQLEITRNLTRSGLADTTKTGKKRFIKMNVVVRELLKRMASDRKSEFVFCQENGSPIEIVHLSRRFRDSQRRAGMTRLIRFHDLRHTFASQFMMRGGALYDLQTMLGHSSSEMTQRYAHLSPAHLEKAAQIVSFYPASAPALKSEFENQKFSGA